MEQWRGKVAVITGASSGIGSKIACKLVEEGLKVVGLARRKERIEQLEKELAGKSGKLYAFRADMTKDSDIIEAFKWTSKNVGPVHVLVNAAGVFDVESICSGRSDTWRRCFDTNVLGLLVATREAVEIMKKNHVAGHIVNISSILGHFVPPNTGSLSVYPATKHAVIALAASLRAELRLCDSFIKITNICPGAVQTDMTANLPRIHSKSDGGSSGPIPMLEAEDIACAVKYVLSTPPKVLVRELMIQRVEEAI